jgi:DnaJ-class molecular chaperone
MRYVNEANSVLSDAAKRAEYDRDEARGNHSPNNNVRGPNNVEVRSLRHQLAESERQRKQLKKKILHFQEEVDVAQDELADSKRLLLEKSRQNKQHQNEVNYLKSECDLLERKNQSHIQKINKYENKIEKISRSLREERQKSCDELARAGERAKQEIEHVKKFMSERSVCYRCNGEAATMEDCTLCEGTGAIQGLWTKCHICHGAGSFASISGEEESCLVCSSKGAREGIHSIPCFKCEGRGGGKDCNVCYKGVIKGFNLQLCPFCRGREGTCENCFGKAFVSCRCGPPCIGHKRNEFPKPPSSLQRRIGLENNDGDWSAKFLTRNWQTPLAPATGGFGGSGNASQPAPTQGTPFASEGNVAPPTPTSDFTSTTVFTPAPSFGGNTVDAAPLATCGTNPAAAAGGGAFSIGTGGLKQVSEGREKLSKGRRSSAKPARSTKKGNGNALFSGGDVFYKNI